MKPDILEFEIFCFFFVIDNFVFEVPHVLKNGLPTSGGFHPVAAVLWVKEATAFVAIVVIFKGKRSNRICFRNIFFPPLKKLLEACLELVIRHVGSNDGLKVVYDAVELFVLVLELQNHFFKLIQLEVKKCKNTVNSQFWVGSLTTF